jgi:hypothetical protein
MLFQVSITIPTDNYRTALDRFKQGGGPPPPNVRMIGRWHHADGSGAVVICETNDPIGLGKWSAEWADVIGLQICPVLTDEEILKAIS